MKPPRKLPPLLLAGLGLIISGSALWALLAAYGPQDPGRPQDLAAVPIQVDFASPELRLRNLQGAEESLSDYIGSVVLVNLWATWCPPCVEEMPALQRFYDSHRSQGLRVIAINDGESAADVDKFVAQHGLTFDVWLDPEYEATERAFKTRNLPSSYVLDRGGRVRLMWIGAINEANLERYVLPLLKE